MSAVMHSDAAGVAPAEMTCAECGSPFKPRRSWQERCSKKCRNAFHGLERRKRAIEARALVMFKALTFIAESQACAGGVQAVPTFCPHCASVEAIKDLKAP